MNIEYDFDDSVSLARYIVRKRSEDERLHPDADTWCLNLMMLQHTLYRLQTVYCSGTYGRLLFSDEFEAWPTGPILPEVYDEFCLHGGSTIRDCDDCRIQPEGNLKRFIDDGIEDLKTRSPWDFVKYSRADLAPWSIVYKISPYVPIPNELLVAIYA